MQNIPKNLHVHFLPPDTHRYVYVYVVLPEILRRYQMHDPIVKSRFKSKIVTPLNASFTKWSNTLKQYFGNFPTNCLNVFDHFVGLVATRLRFSIFTIVQNN